VPDTENAGLPPRGSLPTLRLFIGAGAVELRAIALAASRLTIGRRPYNDVPLDDLTVSGEHAMFRVRNGDCVIHDLNSRNGTLVNGLPIQQRVLVDGDVIDIGIYRIRFEAAADGARASAAASVRIDLAHADGEAAELGGPTMAGAPRPGAASDPGLVPSQSGLAAQQAGDFAPLLPARVEHLSGVRAGQVQTLDRAINRVVGPAEQVAAIARRKGGYYITHLEGMTFPQLNGEPIGLGAQRLADGDLIELAGLMLRFRVGP